MKTTFEKIAAACVIAAFVVGVLLGSALFPAPDKVVEVAVPIETPASADIPKPAEFAADVPVAGEPAPAAALDSLARPASQPQKLGYYYGVQIAGGLRNQNLSLDAAYLARGMQDGYTGAQKLLNEQEMNEVVGTLQQTTGAAAQPQETPQQAEAKKLAAEKAKQEADAFLAENAKKEGVKATASGLQYKILTEGAGPSPTDADSVTVHYRGTLLNGTEFDSSYKRGEPAAFKVTGVIKGWTEALKMMKVGAKWQLWIPPDLAYGNSLLVFEVELLGINDQAKTAE